jgi:hypothetical protein
MNFGFIWKVEVDFKRFYRVLSAKKVWILDKSVELKITSEYFMS